MLHYTQIPFSDLNQILQDSQIAKEALTTRRCEHDIFLHFSKHENHDRFARCLGFTQKETIDITRDAPTMEKKAMAVLNQWLNKNGPDATYYSLANAFVQMKDLELADRVLKYHTDHPLPETSGHVLQSRVYPEIVYPNWDELNEHQKQEKKKQLLAEYDRVRNAYSNVILEIEEFFEESKINPRKVKIKLRSCCPDASELANANEIDLIFCFELIASKTTCINYGLLEDVVTCEKFENDESKKALQKYKTKILIPYLNNSLFAIPSGAFASNHQSASCIQVSLKLHDDIVPTGNEAIMLEHRLAILLKVQSITLAGFRVGSIELLFYIPKEVYDSASPDTPLRQYMEWDKESQSYIITADITTIL